MNNRARQLLGAAREGQWLALVVCAYVALGVTGLAVRLATDGDAAVLAYLLVSMLPVVAIPLGVVIFRPRSAWPWLLLAAGQGAFFIGDVVWTINAAAGDVPFPSMADIPYLAGYPLLAAGLLHFVRLRRPRYRLVPSIDAFAVGIAFAMVLWLLLIERFIHAGDLSLTDKLALMAYPMGDVLLLAAATYMLFAGRGLWRNAQRVLMLALIALLLADVFYTLMLLEEGYRAGWADRLWMASYLLFGLAALLPSMRSLSAADAEASVEHPGWRLLVPALAFAFVPIFAVIQLVGYGHVDVELVIVVEVVLAGLLMLRLYDVARTALVDQQRHATLLSRGSTAFMLVSPGGTVTHYSPLPGSALRLNGEEPVGRPVRSVLRDVALDPSQVDHFLDALSGPARSATADFTLRTASGTLRRMRVSGTLTTSPRALAGMVIDYRDVTLQHEAMSQLKAQAGILANIREAVIVTDLAGNVTHWNDGAARVFGYRPEEMLGQSIATLYPDADPDRMRAELEAIMAGTEVEGDWEGRRKDGSPVIINVHTAAMHGADGQVVGFIGVSSDVTERRLEERRTRRLATAIEQSSEAVLIAGRDGAIEYVNPAFERITGYSQQEVLGQNPRMLKSGVQSPSFYRSMWQALTAHQRFVADLVNRRKDGSLYQVEAVISPIRSAAGEIDGYVAVSRDVTEERRLGQHAERLSRERALIAETLRGLDPHAPPEAIAERICRQVVGLSDVDFACLYVFGAGGKAVPYGFVLADGGPAPLHRLPRRRSAYLQARAERGPWIEPWQPQPDHPYNEVFRERGVTACAYAPVRDGERVVGLLILGSSSGTAHEELSASLPALIEFADISASQLGRAITERLQQRSISDLVARVIRRREFSIAFQPILDLSTNTVVGFEALARFDDGMPPDQRIAQAASVDREIELEMALVRAAVASARDLPAGTWLNVNASPALVLDRRLAGVLATSDRQVIVEVTEHAAIADYVTFRRAAAALGDSVRLAIDDAGAGFSSLRHIVEIKPQMVKLDRALVHGLAGDGARQALITGLAHFAASSGFEVLAEGVETMEDLAALKRLNVRLVQGFLFGEAMSAAEAARYAPGPPPAHQPAGDHEHVRIVWPEVVHADGAPAGPDQRPRVIAPPLVLSDGRPMRSAGRPAK